MSENVISFNVPNLITVGIMVMIFSALVGLAMRIYAGRKANV